uniref:relaxase/mobilization nuclease domain-containing protein n=1 Tax=Amycolatopsis sp. CA-151526 TaxID=3239921 RepID=UPI003F49508D
MIAKVIDERGARTTGLIRYLFGRGRFNEHQNPRVVAAWDPTFIRSASETTIDSFEQGLLGREMEAPMRLHGIRPGAHVYHVPVSIEAEAGALSDEQWQQVAVEAAEKLGFTETRDRAAVPWIAVRHGLSEKGNDHIHFVAVLYREDGSPVDTWNDYAAWEEVRHAAEDRWGLRSTRKRGGGVPDLKRGEVARAAREGRDEPDRVSLARGVRSAAAAARTEAEFVHRLRRAGVLVRPRWESGAQTEATGYSVALKPAEDGRAPVWFGGGKLADDLTLPALRARWREPDDAVAADTRRAWRPRGWRELPTGRQVTRSRLRAEAWEIAGTKTAEVRGRLAALEPGDDAAWAAVAHEAAGALGALADRVDLSHRAQLRQAAASLGRAAQLDRGSTPRVVPDLAPLAGVVRTATDAVIAGAGGPYAVAMLLMQIGRLVQTMQQAHEMAGRAAQARQAADAAQEMLDYIRQAPRPEPDRSAGREPSRLPGHAVRFGEVERPGPTPRKEIGDDGRER